MSQPVESPYALFSFEKFTFTIKVSSLMVLPPYKGAVFRGAFGNMFRRIVCAVPRANCATCLLRSKCLYVAIFEPPPPANYPDAAKFSTAPAPYVLNPPLTSRQVFKPGDNLEFELVLIGPAIEALPYFIYTFVELGKRGLGAERGRYKLIGVDQIREGQLFHVYDGRTHALSICPPEGRGPRLPVRDDHISEITIEFLTPLRLKMKGDLVTNLSFPVLYDRLAHRISLLSAFYNPGAVLPNFSPFGTAAQNIRAKLDELHWYDWERYSTRQKDTMNFGGLKGRISFCGDLTPFVPYLRLAEQVNVGQGTSFGLGKPHILTFA